MAVDFSVLAHSGIFTQITNCKLDILLLCSKYVTWSRETVPNRTSGKIKLTPPAYSHTTVLLVCSLTLVYLLEADRSRSEFTVMRKARMAASGTGKGLGWLYRKRQKFQGWKVSWFAWFIRYAGKSFAIFSITTFIHSWFSNSTKQLRAFQRKLRVPHWLQTCVCRFHAFQDGWPYSHRRRRASYTVEEMKHVQIPNCFLVSFFCKLLPNVLAEIWAETL